MPSVPSSSAVSILSASEGVDTEWQVNSRDMAKKRPKNMQCFMTGKQGCNYNMEG